MKDSYSAILTGQSANIGAIFKLNLQRRYEGGIKFISVNCACSSQIVCFSRPIVPVPGNEWVGLGHCAYTGTSQTVLQYALPKLGIYAESRSKEGREPFTPQAALDHFDSTRHGLSCHKQNLLHEVCENLIAQFAREPKHENRDFIIAGSGCSHIGQSVLNFSPVRRTGQMVNRPSSLSYKAP